MSIGRPKGLRVRTACATESEFIAFFQRNCDESSVFAPTEKMLPTGADCAFSLELADGQPMLRGLGVVVNAWPTNDNRFARPGVHIMFTQLTSTSEPILDRLLQARVTSARVRPSPTQRRFAAVAPAPSAWPEEESVVGDVRQSITRDLQLQTAVPVPIEEKSTHTTRYEGPLRAPAIPAPRAVEEQTIEDFALPLPPPRATPPPIPAQATQALDVDDIEELRPPTVWTAIAGWLRAFAARVAAGWRRVRPRLRAVGAPITARVAPMARRAKPHVVAATKWVTARSAWVIERVRPTASRLATVTRKRASQLAAATRERTAQYRTTTWWPKARIAAVFAGGILVGVIITLSARPSPAPRATTPVAAITPPRCPPVVAVAAPAAVVAAPADPAPPADPPVRAKKKKVGIAPARLKTSPPTTKAAPAIATKAPAIATKAAPAIATKAPAIATKAAPAKAPATTKAPAPTAPMTTKSRVTGKRARCTTLDCI